MSARVNLVGRRFGSLIVESFFGIKNQSTSWSTKCDCGNTRIYSRKVLLNKTATSCGCKHGNPRHRRSKTSAYQVWQDLKYRCENKRHKSYPRYGGRGIVVCDRWRSFENFLADMGDPPKGLSIDRLNNDGPYSPENCRWASNRQQNLNREPKRGLKGVYLVRGRYWKAQLSSTHIGYFKDQITAARAYNEAAIIAYGADARLNNIPGDIAFGVHSD